MKRLALVWFSVIFCVVDFLYFVDSGRCSVNSDCKATQFTRSSCTNGVCNCISADYGSIQTGCGYKHEKPDISLEIGRINALLIGTTGRLFCNTLETPILSFAWYLNDVLIEGKTQSEIVIDTPGRYRCQVVSNSEESLNSEKSDEITITSIGADTTLSLRIKLVVITFSPSSGLFEKIFLDNMDFIPKGGEVTLVCIGAPLGYSGEVTFLDGATVIASSNTSLTAEITFGLTDMNTIKSRCALETFNGVSFSLSDNFANLPRVDTASITNVAIFPTISDSSSLKYITGDNNGDVFYNVGAEGPTIRCTSFPPEQFFDRTKQKVYEFLNGTNSLQKSSSNTYKVDTSTIGSAEYRCELTFNGTSYPSILSRKITVSDNLIPLPSIVKESSGNIFWRSTLVLSCGDSTYVADSYQWSFDNNTIERQYDKTIQLYNFTVADIGVYKCRAVKSRYTTAEASFVAIPKPTINRDPPGTIYGAGNSYVLRCNTGSNVTTGWTYTWKKNSSDTTTQSDFYIINNANADEHNGLYTCNASYNGVSSTSDVVNVTIIAANIVITDSSGLVLTDKTYNVGANGPTISCSTTPVLEYPTNAVAPEFAFSNGSTSLQVGNTDSYSVVSLTPSNTTYNCSVTYNGTTFYSPPSVFLAFVIKPTVTREPNGTVYGAGGDYILKCNSGANETSGWTYSWTKNGTETTIETLSYKITNANAALHNGFYTCTSIFNGASSTSDAATVIIEAPGKRCTVDTDCLGTNYTGKCTTRTPAVCDCASNYYLKGDDCVSGATALLSCVLVVVLTSLRTFLF